MSGATQFTDIIREKIEPILAQAGYEFQEVEINEDNDALVLLYVKSLDPAPASLEVLETFVHTDDGTAKCYWLRIYVRGRNIKTSSARPSDDMHRARGWTFDDQDNLLTVLDEAAHTLLEYLSR